MAKKKYGDLEAIATFNRENGTNFWTQDQIDTYRKENSPIRRFLNQTVQVPDKPVRRISPSEYTNYKIQTKDSMEDFVKFMNEHPFAIAAPTVGVGLSATKK